MTLISDVMDRHQLIGIDSSELCSCGVRSASWLEHLADVALDLTGTTRPVKRSRARVPREVDEKTLWEIEQRRAANLASFARMTETWPEPKRPARRYRFTPAQLAIADRALERRNEAA